jgi:hypothetical protein
MRFLSNIFIYCMPDKWFYNVAMTNDLKQISPEIRRLVIQYARKAGMEFGDSIDFLIVEGLKSICEHSPNHCPVVFSPVDKSVDKSV